MKQTFSRPAPFPFRATRFHARRPSPVLKMRTAELKGTPIVFLTAAVRRHQVEENDGIICEHPCLAKPASMPEIVQCIETHLGH